jgi:RHS repeat-associated protein
MFFPEPEPEPVPPTCTWCAPKPAPEPPSSSYIVKHAYSYDANNNLTFWDDQVNNQYDVRVTYDGLDRIDTISDSYLGAGDVNYDTMGNITYYKLGSRTLNYNYNSSKRLSSVSGSKSYTFNYDDVGNVTDNGSRSFTYNRAGQMVQSGGNSYVYDGNGKRVKTIDSKGVSYSVYGSNGKLMYRQENGQHKDYYYLGNTLVAKKKGSTVTYVHTDYLGSPAAETSSNGDVLARMHYQPFGESIETPSDDAGYTGHKFDTDLDLSYMQARYYDPVIGRFYSNDPVGFTGDVDTFNRYSYVANNPYKYTDPNGESKKFVSEAVKIVGTEIKSLGKVTHSAAVRIRRAGGDLRSPDTKTATNIEKAAFPQATQTRPELHPIIGTDKMGEKHIHSKTTSKNGTKQNRMTGHHFIQSSVAALAVGLELLGDGLEATGGFMENIETNLPSTMGVLDALDPVAMAERVQNSGPKVEIDNET